MPSTTEQAARKNQEQASLPCRIRKHIQLFPPLTLSDAVDLVETSGRRDMVLRMGHAARQLEAAGHRSVSLAELAAAASLAPAAKPEDSPDAETAKLQRLLRDAVASAVKVGEAAHDEELRSICFALCRHCQRAAAEIGRRQLWDHEVEDAF